jgi:hypothetical protein
MAPGMGTMSYEKCYSRASRWDRRFMCNMVKCEDCRLLSRWPIINLATVSATALRCFVSVEYAQY